MTDPDADAAEAERRRRQAPRYGEYATPEEIAELRGPDAPPLVPVESAPPPPPIGRPVPGPPPEGQRRPAGWDGIATIGLLAFGAYNVVSGIVGFLDLRSFLTQALTQAGAVDAEVPAGVQPLGYVLIVVWALLFVVAVVWSMRRLRHGRVAFWVPVLVGSVAVVGTSLVFLVVLQSLDPGAVLQNQT